MVPVVRTDDVGAARSLVTRLLAAGIDTIELTTTIPGWEALVAEFRSDAWLGVGTVLSAHDAVRVAVSGAAFAVSPRLVPEARVVLAANGVPFVEGGFTPTEVLDAASRGVAKLFPAHVGGPRYLKSLLAVAPEARIMPTGGIALDEVGEWLAAGALAVGVGSDLNEHAERLAAFA